MCIQLETFYPAEAAPASSGKTHLRAMEYLLLSDSLFLTRKLASLQDCSWNSASCRVTQPWYQLEETQSTIHKSLWYSKCFLGDALIPTYISWIWLQKRLHHFKTCRSHGSWNALQSPVWVLNIFKTLHVKKKSFILAEHNLRNLRKHVNTVTE